MSQERLVRFVFGSFEPDVDRYPLFSCLVKAGELTLYGGYMVSGKGSYWSEGRQLRCGTPPLPFHVHLYFVFGYL